MNKGGEQFSFNPGTAGAERRPRLVADNRGLIGRGLGKSFKRRPVLREVNVSVQRGEVVGLLGPNGAGKTTCFYIITGLIAADTGIVTLLGNVTVTRGPNAIRGQYAVVDLNNNISRMMTAPATPGTAAPRVEGLFVRQDNGSTSSVPVANTAPGSAPGSVQKP